MPAKQLRVLITGMGGDLGQAMAKSLRLMDMPVEIIGADAGVGSTCGVFADRAYSLPFASAVEYGDAVAQLVSEEDISVVVPGSEAEILVLSRLVYEGKAGFSCPLVCLPYDHLLTFGDKLHCFERLADKVDLPAFADGMDPRAVEALVKKTGFPCVVKSRQSCGSKALGIARTTQELEGLLARTPSPVVQEYLDDSEGEFTLGVYVHGDDVWAIAFRRDLGPIGASWFAEVVFDQPDVLDYATSVARATGIQGSFNVQVRKCKGKIGLLEINARFSSLVAARAAAGFRDMEWSLKDALGISYTPPEAYRPLRFQRYLHEVVDFGDGYIGLQKWLPRVSDAGK